MSNFPPNFLGSGGALSGMSGLRDSLRKSSFVPGGLGRNSYKELQKKAKARGVNSFGLSSEEIKRRIVNKNKTLGKKAAIVTSAAGIAMSMSNKKHADPIYPVYDDYMNKGKTQERNRKLGLMHGPQTGEVSKSNRYSPYIDSGYGPHGFPTRPFHNVPDAPILRLEDLGSGYAKEIPQFPYHAGQYPKNKPAGYVFDDYFTKGKDWKRKTGSKWKDEKLRTKEVQGEVENRNIKELQWSDYSKFPISATVSRVQTTPSTITLGKIEGAEEIASRKNKSIISETSKLPNTFVPEIQGSPLRQGEPSQVISPTVKNRQITLPKGNNFPHTVGMAGYHLFSGTSKAVGTSLLPAEIVLRGAGNIVGGLSKFLRGE